MYFKKTRNSTDSMILNSSAAILSDRRNFRMDVNPRGATHAQRVNCSKRFASVELKTIQSAALTFVVKNRHD